MAFQVEGAYQGRGITKSDSGGETSKFLPSLYFDPPFEDIALEEFEELAIDRLRVLKGIEAAKLSGKRENELTDAVFTLLKQHMQEDTAEATRRKDAISHFVLRLAYCQTDELRRWFIQHECDLFRQKFRIISEDEKVSLLEKCHLPCTKLKQDRFKALEENLLAVYHSQQSERITKEELWMESKFFQVPFETVPELVAMRKVYVENGMVFLKASQLTALLVGHFRAQLSKCLILTARKWDEFAAEEQQRLAPLVDSLNKRYLGPDYDNGVQRGGLDAQVTVQDLPSLATESFPLCMSHLYHRLKANHHLKHGGRMQLGLFLKGIGLNLQDALAFWKAEFAPKYDAEQFEKKFAYNIRHNYGKEGNRRDYTPYSCMKIITSTPGNDDYHGCPYRHKSENDLRSMLQVLSLDSQKIGSILDKVKNKHFQLACQETFEGVHGCACMTGINHPNQYFDESRRVRSEQKQEGSPSTPVQKGDASRPTQKTHTTPA
uniref:DNA primase large subunit n=1 Tax=Picocystis salinarum TaxID=88271 RepID=A0A7S3UDP7_9CHLO|mmetsp:Transcript_6408/g.40024  ORF Transcript_6408/g.40024 Transcript_6408/m.40024 type:complete len:491 (-) Transcript_6408:469-1941(-)